MKKIVTTILVLSVFCFFVFLPPIFASSLLLQEKDHFRGSILLGSPTPSYVCVSILPDYPSDVYLVWGNVSPYDIFRSIVAQADSMNPALLTMNHLQPGQSYFYRLFYKGIGEELFSSTSEYFFHTPKLPGQSFSFLIQSDSHLHDLRDDSVYLESLRAMAQIKADFVIDLGDTFIQRETSQAPYRSLQQRPYFDLLTRRSHLFLALGNHDGELANYFDETEDNLAVAATRARKRYYLNPSPCGFYSGNTQPEPFVGLPCNYYAFDWGEALFVVLDPYRYSYEDPSILNEGWRSTLGKAQYDWLQETLEKSSAKFKFVFAHRANGWTRGGHRYSRLFEWGGYAPNGEYLFDQMRPGWGRPIHQIMKDNGVTIFFQGHDHLFAMEVVDGIVYQTVPRVSEYLPSRVNTFALYPDAYILLNSGFLKVELDSERTEVSYYRSHFVSSKPQEGNIGEVFVYSIDKEGQVSILKHKEDDLSKYGQAYP